MKKFKGLLIALLMSAALLLLAAATTEGAATIYVGGEPGDSSTVQKAFTGITAHGTIVHVRAGSYNEDTQIVVNYKNNIILRGDGSDRTHVCFQGSSGYGLIAYGDNFKIEDMTIRDSTRYFIQASDCDSMTVEDCEVFYVHTGASYVFRALHDFASIGTTWNCEVANDTKDIRMEGADNYHFINSVFNEVRLKPTSAVLNVTVRGCTFNWTDTVCGDPDGIMVWILGATNLIADDNTINIGPGVGAGYVIGFYRGTTGTFDIDSLTANGSRWHQTEETVSEYAVYGPSDDYAGTWSVTNFVSDSLNVPVFMSDTETTASTGGAGTLTNLTITNCYTKGVEISTNSTVISNSVVDNTGFNNVCHGFLLGSDSQDNDPPADKARYISLTGVRAYECSYGTVVKGVDVYVDSCLFVDCGKGIYAKGSLRTIAANNTVYSADEAVGLSIGNGVAPLSCTIKNNKFVDCTEIYEFAAEDDDAGTWVIEYNLIEGYSTLWDDAGTPKTLAQWQARGYDLLVSTDSTDWRALCGGDTTWLMEEGVNGYALGRDQTGARPTIPTHFTSIQMAEDSLGTLVAFDTGDVDTLGIIDEEYVGYSEFVLEITGSVGWPGGFHGGWRDSWPGPTSTWYTQ